MHDRYDTFDPSGPRDPAWTACDIPACGKPGTIKYSVAPAPVVPLGTRAHTQLISVHLCNEHMGMSVEDALEVYEVHRALLAPASTPSQQVTTAGTACAGGVVTVRGGTGTMAAAPGQNITIAAGQGAGGAPQGVVSIQGSSINLQGSVSINGVPLP